MPTSRVAVIGAGASALVLDLVRHGYTSLDAVDIAEAALDQLAGLLGDDAVKVRRLRADVREVGFDSPIDVWHDRATFHFLTSRADQAAYVRRAREAVRPGGHVVLATFSERGPAQCSGLPVARHSLGALCDLFGESFQLIDTFERDHMTPWGAPQAFTHALVQRRTSATDARQEARDSLVSPFRFRDGHKQFDEACVPPEATE